MTRSSGSQTAVYDRRLGSLPGHHPDGMRSKLLVFGGDEDAFIEHRVIDGGHDVPRSEVGVQVFGSGSDVELFGDITEVSTQGTAARRLIWWILEACGAG